MKPFRFFIHAGSKPGPVTRVQEVLNDILSYVEKSPSFLNDCEKIVIFTSDDSLILPKHEKIENRITDRPYDHAAFKAYYDFAVDHEGYNLLFGHCKGTNAHPDCDFDKQDDWRRLMCYFSIAKYLDCIKILEDHQTCGVNFQNQPSKHYSGGFVWATSEYIKTLPCPDTLDKNDRYSSEMWIGTNLKNPHCIYHSNINHYRQRYPKELYEDKSLIEKDK